MIVETLDAGRPNGHILIEPKMANCHPTRSSTRALVWRAQAAGSGVPLLCFIRRLATRAKLDRFG